MAEEVRKLGERLRSRLWPLLRRVFPSVTVQCLEIVNVGLVERPLESIAQHFRSALGFIEAGGEDVNQTLCSNLRRVAIVRGNRERIGVRDQKYGTSLIGHEGRNAFYLACRLLWAAKYIELTARKRPLNGGDEDSIRHESYDTVLEFASRFPEGEQWVRYLERERLNSLG